MFIKYKNYIGRLKNYELKDKENIFVILDVQGIEMRFTCSEYDISIPNIMGNSKFMYEISKELESEKDDWL